MYWTNSQAHFPLLCPKIANYKSVFDSVVVGAFQIIFRAKMHANDVFSFFKNYF
jgi:hypothetical protein